jgi:hypothetical protein
MSDIGKDFLDRNHYLRPHFHGTIEGFQFFCDKIQHNAQIFRYSFDGKFIHFSQAPRQPPKTPNSQ